jgi:hypothetical protein
MEGAMSMERTRNAESAIPRGRFAPTLDHLCALVSPADALELLHEVRALHDRLDHVERELTVVGQGTSR